MSGHGREPLFDDIDLSRTVGWLNIDYPVLLNLEGTHDLGESLQLVKEHLHALPRRGIGYGMLRYLYRGSGAERLRSVPRSEVYFNYWGPIPSHFAQFTLINSFGWHHLDPQSMRPYVLSIVGSIEEGQLILHWGYSQNLHKHSTIEKLAHMAIELLKKLTASLQSHSL